MFSIFVSKGRRGYMFTDHVDELAEAARSAADPHKRAQLIADLWAASDAGSGFDSEEEREEAEEEDKDGDESDLATGNVARNSAIGFQADFVSSQARSAALRLPSATFSRMADSENRPAYCPFR